MKDKVMLKMVKGEGSSTIECKDEEHKNKLIERFKKRGYKQAEYVEEVKKESFPF